MSRLIRRIGTLVLVAIGLAAVPQAVAQAEDAPPWRPLKYHTTSGDFDQEHPATGVKAFVLTFDEMSPQGNNRVFQGYVGTKAYAGWAAMITYDPVAGHSVWTFNAVLTDGNSLPVPLVGTATVTYDRQLNVHSVAVQGAFNGEAFTVAPMRVVL